MKRRSFLGGCLAAVGLLGCKDAEKPLVVGIDPESSCIIHSWDHEVLRNGRRYLVNCSIREEKNIRIASAFLSTEDWYVRIEERNSERFIETVTTTNTAAENLVEKWLLRSSSSLRSLEDKELGKRFLQV